MNFDELVLVAVVDELSEEQQARGVANAVEFRLDTVQDSLDQIDRFDGELPIIASTGPDRNEETTISDDIAERLSLAVEYDSVEAISIDLAAARSNERLLDRIHDSNTKLIVSYHDFVETPDRHALLEIVRDAAAYGDAVTISAEADTPGDTLSLLSTILDATEEGIVIGGASMGEIGRHTRVVAPEYGSKFAFAPLTLESANALPGQFPLQELAELIEQVSETGTTLHEPPSHLSVEET